MICYGYDENNNYTGQVTCQPNPMSPGNFLEPANTTSVDPGTPSAGKIHNWNGTTWDEIDDPAIAAALESQIRDDGHKTIVIYRTETGKDKMVLGHYVKSLVWDYDADEPTYNAALVSSNADVDYAEFDNSVASNLASVDQYDITDQAIDDTDPENKVLVTRTDVEYTDAVAAATLQATKDADSFKLVVFYRTETGKDKVALSSDVKNSAWDYDASEPNYNEALVSTNSDVDYAEFADGINSTITYDDLGVVNQVIDDTDPENKVFAARSGTDYDADRAAMADTLIRASRDSLIVKHEWKRTRHKDELDQGKVVDVDTTLTSAEYSTLMTYIQDLRDVPALAAVVSDPVAWWAAPAWPTEPSF